MRKRSIARENNSKQKEVDKQKDYENKNDFSYNQNRCNEKKENEQAVTKQEEFLLTQVFEAVVLM